MNKESKALTYAVGDVVDVTVSTEDISSIHYGVVVCGSRIVNGSIQYLIDEDGVWCDQAKLELKHRATEQSLAYAISQVEDDLGDDFDDEDEDSDEESDDDADDRHE